MPWPERPCPECGEVLPVNLHAAHKRKVHGWTYKKDEDPAVTDDHPVDDPPKTRRKPRQHAGGGAVPAMTVEAQLNLIYNLVATLTASRVPGVSGAIKVNAARCAKADEQLLRRWPRVYEAMEKGMIAGDILAVFMAHYPILMALREEIEARRREQAILNGQVPGGVEEPVAA